MTTIYLHTQKIPAVEAFIDEFWEISQPHPFARSVRLIGTVGVTLQAFNGGVHINDLHQFGEAGEGGGTHTLRMLIQLADKHGVKLSATAKAYDRDKRFPLRTSASLRDWYVRHGFVVRCGSRSEGYNIVYRPS